MPDLILPVQKGEGSCSVWVHLHSTICTEWSKEYMVIKQAGHQEGLVKAPKTIHRCILKTSVTTPSQVRCRQCGGLFPQE